MNVYARHYKFFQISLASNPVLSKAIKMKYIPSYIPYLVRNGHLQFLLELARSKVTKKRSSHDNHIYPIEF